MADLDDTIDPLFDTDAKPVIGGAAVKAAAADQIYARNGKQVMSDAQAAQIAAHEAALPGKAPLASPALTGAPTAPTAAPGTNSAQIATTAFIKAAIDALVNGAPGALDALNELAAAIGNDPNFAATMSAALGNRVRVDTATQGLSDTQKDNARANIGLAMALLSGASIDSLVETPTAKILTSSERTKLAGIDAGAQVNSITSVAGRTGAVTLAKADVGLSSVDNTPDLAKPVSNAGHAQRLDLQAALALADDAPNVWVDPDMIGSGWQGAITVGVTNGHPSITVAGATRYANHDFTAHTPAGEPFALSLEIAAATITAGYDAAIYVVQLNSGGAQIAGTGQTVLTLYPGTPTPRPYAWAMTRHADAVRLQVYVFGGNHAAVSVTLAQMGVYPGVVGIYRPAVEGRTVNLEESRAERAALAEMWDIPNVNPDPFVTGLTTAGWVSAIPVVTLPRGRRMWQATGVLRKLRIPVAQLGGVGATFSASALIRPTNNGAANSVLIVQTKADTTVVSDGIAPLLDSSGETWLRHRRRPVNNVTILPTAAFIELWIDASGNAQNSIAVSGFTIQQGGSAVHRPERPSFAGRFALMQPLVAGSTAARPAGAPAGWLYSDTSLGAIVKSDGAGGWAVIPQPVTFDYYVDGRAGGPGSDANNGLSETTPFATIGKALAMVGTSANKRIGVRRGSAFRKQSINSAAAGLYIGGYGPWSDRAPRFLGSRAYSKAALTDAGGGIYTVALNYSPATCALENIATGQVIKLYNPDANTNPPAQGNWHWSANVLKIYPGFDITGWRLEVPRNDGPQYGHQAGAANQTVEAIKFEHWRNQGAASELANTSWLDVWCNYCGSDGFDQTNPACTNFLIRGGGAIGNGRRFGSDLGPGDGSSAHDGCTGTIEFATFEGNTQTGVGNLPDTKVTVRYCVLRDNHVNLQTYNHVGGSAGYDHATGEHYWYYNKLVMTATGVGTMFALNNSTVPAAVVRIRNNTMVIVSGRTGVFAMGTFGGGAVDFANNILALASGATATFGMANYMATDGSSGSVTSRNNIVFGASGAWQSGGYDATRGGGSETGLLTTDPLLCDIAGGDYSLLPGSPAITSGVNLGYARDFDGRAPAATPSRGALEYVAA